MFTLKANQRITHFKRLTDVDEDVRDFLAIGKSLGDRLGCVLFQCPPSLKYDRGLIESFVGYLPPGPPRFAMEFRHDSWREARDLLHDQGIAWCVAETDEKDPEPEDLSWEPAGYLRLRKTEYTDEELRGWADRIGPAIAGGADVFCYFKHEDEGASPKMAKRLEDSAGPQEPSVPTCRTSRAARDSPGNGSGNALPTTGHTLRGATGSPSPSGTGDDTWMAASRARWMISGSESSGGSPRVSMGSDSQASSPTLATKDRRRSSPVHHVGGSAAALGVIEGRAVGSGIVRWGAWAIIAY